MIVPSRRTPCGKVDNGFKVNTFSRKSSRAEGAELSAAGRGGAPSIQSLGAMLRERREAMGVTLAEVEVATRIRQKYLSALEAEEWHLLPGEVVGRGFLRNYADYLGMDAQEIMDRRRATTDSNLTSALSTTSAGSMLPPEREVDYRPKEVDLKDEGDGIQRGEIRLAPILGIVGVALVVGLIWWGVVALREPLANALAGVTSGVTGLFERAEPTATSAGMAVVNTNNLNGAAATPDAANAAAVDSQGSTPAGSASDGVVTLGSGGGGGATNPPAPAAGDPGSPNAAAPTSDPLMVLVPTATPAEVAAAPTPEPPTPMPEAPTPTPEPPTPTPEPPTPTPEPPTPTPELPTPEPTPTEPPTPAPPPVAAAACGDARSVISSPGVGQVVNGVTGVTGNATHEAFQYYKLEYAPGANAGGGYVYFDGSNVQIAGGVLGNLDTFSLPNGDYTIRLTVVDQSGNFPPPCDVTITVQN